MTHSMTAFARVQQQFDTGIFCWEIRSVNHRYLDVAFRLPEAFRFLEGNLRTRLRGKLNRGKLECYLKFQDLGGNNQALLINESLINKLIDAGASLAATKHVANDLAVSSILAWPGVVQLTEPDIDVLAHSVEQLFQEALDQLLAARQVEGQALRLHVQNRLIKLSQEVTQAKQQVVSYREQSRDKLLMRLNGLQMEVDNPRIEQEIALILARMDVNEELDRLQTHIAEVGRIMESSEAAGRRLDFLMQELNREANTLSSKSDSITLTQHAVEMKVLIEQMREQIQNIE
ncbi:YicC/YloC family endoribonuclease [Legionella fairfieldensis]|uniref:YicC/YloC family endoribonuclease n=1 Tax=Legionella fairfieldensis TaxID=45064 RepID=UPI00048E8E05|nr:YicC/YloC family endoribonuclease [Legionella fairfieldensis]